MKYSTHKKFWMTLFSLAVFLLPISFSADFFHGSEIKYSFEINSAQAQERPPADPCRGVIASLSPLCIAESFFQVAGNILLSLMGSVLGISGFILDAVLYITVSQMKTVIDGFGAIDEAWKLLRDFANMFFIFILLTIAISTILNINTAQTWRAVRNVILGALLINFSFFFTNFLIDASNITALAFYNKFPAIATAADFNPTDYGKSNQASGTIMGALRLQSIYSNKGSAAGGIQGYAIGQVKALTNVVTFFITTIMGAVFYLIAACVFLAAAILFIIRFAILIMVMIFSPLAFASIASPHLKPHIWNKWWKALSSQLLFAPAYMLLTLLALSIVVNPGFTTALSLDKSATFANAFANAGSATVSIIINFIIVIILLVTAMVTAKSLGATGAGALNKFGKGLADGSRSWIGRNTLGRGASWADDKLKENKLFNEKTGRFLRSFTTTKLAESKYGGGQSWQDEKKLTKEVKAKRTEIEDKEALNAYINRPAGTPPPIGGKLPEQVLRGMTREQKGKLSKDLLTNPEVLRHLSAEDFNHILDKSEKSDADKVAIKGARSQALRNATNVANFLNAVPNRNAQENEELRNARTLARDITGKIRGRDMQENISPDLLNEPEVLRALSNDQIKELPKIQMVTDASAMAISQDATERAKGKALLKALVPKIRGNDLAAELDETVLANQNVVESMTKGQIKDLEDAVTDRAIRARIGVAINTAGAGHPAHSYINDQRNNANWI